MKRALRGRPENFKVARARTFLIKEKSRIIKLLEACEEPPPSPASVGGHIDAVDSGTLKTLTASSVVPHFYAGLKSAGTVIKAGPVGCS